MLAELQRLYDLGYRGHVDFVDDNLIGNRKSLRIFLPELIAWQEAHDYPFEFSTEASVNLADDYALLQLMRKANFFALFVGIESPDPETLVHTRKKQNTRRNLAESIHRLYGAGMYVTAGFIVGFDTEKVSVADAMVDLIEEAAIPASSGIRCILRFSSWVWRKCSCCRIGLRTHPDSLVQASSTLFAFGARKA